MDTLKDLRNVFPNYPSEFDIAQNPNNWSASAQQYYLAARILDEEIRKTHVFLHKNQGIEINEEIAIRMISHEPAIFCFAFAIELLIKAVYIKLIASNTMQPNEKIDFGNHKISELINKISVDKNLGITKDESELISKIEFIVVNGKYPAKLKPSNLELSKNLPHFDYFKSIAEPLYQKLSAFL